MTTDSQTNARKSILEQLKTNWGSLLFCATLIATLVFFWWLLIHSGGVEIHHG